MVNTLNLLLLCNKINHIKMENIQPEEKKSNKKFFIIIILLLIGNATFLGLWLLE